MKNKKIEILFYFSSNSIIFQSFINLNFKTMMNQAIEVIECPICMDEIDEKNKVTTECGHCFHTSCLMTNVAHNGFGCPYCRTAMAEEPADNNTDEEYDEFSFDEEEEGPDYNDNVLRGARWLFQRAEGEDLDEEEDSVLDENEEVVEEQVDKPSVDYIVERLVQQGVTMADLVKSVLLFDHGEFEHEESFERGDSELFGKFRIIISNFRPVVAAAAAIVEDECICRYETSHFQSSRLRQHDSVEEERSEFGIGLRIALAHSTHCEEKEEKSVKMPFSFQMKGSCRRNEVS